MTTQARTLVDCQKTEATNTDSVQLRRLSIVFCRWMVLESNVMLEKKGTPLPNFSPKPIPQSAGVNLFSQNLLEFEDMSNPYVFPPFGLVGPVLKFLYSFRIPFTIVVP